MCFAGPQYRYAGDSSFLGMTVGEVPTYVGQIGPNDNLPLEMTCLGVLDQPDNEFKCAHALEAETSAVTNDSARSS